MIFIKRTVVVLLCCLMIMGGLFSTDLNATTKGSPAAIDYKEIEKSSPSYDLNLNEVKWFSVDLKQNAGYLFALSANLNAGYLYFELYDTKGNKLGELNDEGYPVYRGLPTNRSKYFQKTASKEGKYYLKVYGTSNASGNFSFIIRNAWFNADYLEEKSSAQPYTDYLAKYLKSGTFDIKGWRQHYYHFNGKKNANFKLTITTSLNSGTIEAELYDSNFNLLRKLKDNGYPKYNSIGSGETGVINHPIAIDGNYYIRILTNNNAEGNYTLNVEGIDVSNNNPPKINTPPTIISAGSTSEGINLSWQVPSSATQEIIGYNFYRGKASNNYDKSPITDFPILGTTYMDKNIQKDNTYYYICKAVYKDRTESPSSNEVRVVSTGSNNKIVLKINDPYMMVGNVQKEIDPGNGTSPLVQNGRTMVPIRAIIENLGGTVDWSGSENRVTVNYKSHVLKLWLGDYKTLLNDVYKETDVVPQAIRGRTMLPLRFVVESLGLNVEWDGITQTITILF